MSAALGKLVAEDALREAYALRSRKVGEKTITASTDKALQMKREAEEQDGWALAKKNKRSLRMQGDKPVDRQLEDDVWSLFYRMGFREMNADRNFMVTPRTTRPSSS